MPSEWDHRGRYLLLLVLLLGGFLRLYHLGTPYISEDEAYHAVVASRWAETGSPLPPSGIAYTRGMPLIAMEGLILRYLPFELETSVRLPSALLGVLNIWLFFLLGRRYGGVPLGLIAATVFAVSPWCISMGTMARMYEFLMTGSLLCLLSYERLVESPNGRNAALLAAALCVAVTAHQLGMLLMILPMAGIVVHTAQPRLALFLGMAAAGQLAFLKAYSFVLEILVPSSVKASEEAASGYLLNPIFFGLQQIEGQGLLWTWLGGAALLLLGAVSGLRHKSRYELLRLLPGVVLILGFGIAGFLVISGLVFTVFFALSDHWQKLEAARVHRLYLTGLYLATILFWALLAVVIVIQQGSFSIGGLLEAFEPTVRSPEIAFEAILPLLGDPRTIGLFYVGMAGLIVVLIRILWKGPLLPAHSSLTARILFLLGTLSVIGIANSTYTSHRYIYFLFPVALLSFLEIMSAYWKASGGRMRVALPLVGLLFLGLSELPRAVAQMPDRDGHRDVPRRVQWLPDYLGSEDRLKHNRAWKQLDYRAAGKALNTRLGEGDLLLADAAHQLQVYLPAVPIQGHLSPPLMDYQIGEKHYFTGSVLLRTPKEMIKFLEPYSMGKSTRVWIALTGYRSIWQDIFLPTLSEYRVWTAGDIGVYSITADELLAILRSVEATGAWAGQYPASPGQSPIKPATVLLE